MSLRKFDLNEEAKKFLSGGILSKSDMEIENIECKFHCLRMPIAMMKSIDKERKTKIGISRTRWILDAIETKLKKIGK